MHRLLVCLVVIAAAHLSSQSRAFAQSTAGGASLQIPPDVRGEGMGRVWAPLETTPYAAWGNVGGLGLLHGVQAVQASAQLVPDLAPDVFHEYASVAVGYTPFPDWVIPINVSLGYNHTRLNYGESVITDPGSPNPIGTFEPYETVKGFTIAMGLFDAIGAGFGVKRLEVNLVPVELGDGQGEADTYDYGIMARSPFLVFDQKSDRPFSTEWEPKGQASVRAIGGLSWSNRGKDIFLSAEQEGDPLPRVRRESIGLELNILPVDRFIDDTSTFPSWVLRDTHVARFSIGLGREDSLIDEFIPPEIRDTLSKNAIEGIVTYDGWELTIMDMIYYRRGSIFDDPGRIEGYTEGWGVSVFGFFGYDHATIPQFGELERVTKESWWVRIPLDWP